ncbi:amidohydrolase [Streptomyces sp. NPDC053542]|uniref:amidohydrolase n=1 Tax=Streptomyces sp. NPDC053542 TaxID=3365710 RepID=UPI0037CF9E60
MPDPAAPATPSTPIDPTAPADLVLLNGHALTLDAAFRTAEAVAVRGGRIAATGTTSELRPLIGPRTEVVDLAGGTVLPGINDSHLHACAFGATRPPLAVDVSSPTVSSIADIRAAVRAQADRQPPGTWIFGNGWDIGYLDECRKDSARTPTRWDLDEVSPDHPVLLYEFSGHTAWLNSRALEAAGITPDTDAPPGGIIERRADGAPTGILRESAQELVNTVIPAMTEAAREAAIRAAIDVCHAEGITSFTEPGLGPGGKSLFLGSADTATLKVYARMAREGQLRARVSVLLLPLEMGGAAAGLPDRLAALEGLCDGADPRLLSVLGVKLFADGVPPSRTAWMSEEYANGGGHGSLCLHGRTHTQRVDELNAIIRHVHATGHQLGVHITGDAGIDAVVDAFAAAQLDHPRPDARHYIIHGDFASPRALATLAKHGWGANMNPGVKDTIADLMDGIVGPERSAYQWPVRSAVDAGIPVTASSDAPITYPNWRAGVSSMLLRRSKATGRPSGPDQCVDLQTALRAYTTHATRQDFAESWKGTVTPGKTADLCVLAGDLLHTPPEDIPSLPVTMTIFDGEIVHDTR